MAMSQLRTCWTWTSSGSEYPTVSHSMVSARCLCEGLQLLAGSGHAAGISNTRAISTASGWDRPRGAAEVRLVGCTIEDATGNPDGPLYDVRLAVERIAAAAQSARTLPSAMLTAQAHNFVYAAPSLGNTISHLQAFEKA